MKIERAALFLIVKILISCADCKEHYMFLIDFLEKRKKAEFALKIFREKFPQAKFYPQLETYISSLHKTKVTKKDVLVFFGGHAHEEKIKSDLDEVKLPEEEKLKILFLHLALPVRILGKTEDLYHAEYANAGYQVRVAGLVAFPEDQNEVIEGKTVLIHHSLIIDVSPDKKNIRSMLDNQAKLKKFGRSLKLYDKKTVALPERVIITRKLVEELFFHLPEK